MSDTKTDKDDVKIIPFPAPNKMTASNLFQEFLSEMFKADNSECTIVISLEGGSEVEFQLKIIDIRG